YFGKSSSTNGSTADNTLEIDDPLYGNIGGMEEVEAVLNAAETIQECCDGLVDWLAGLQESANISKEGLTLRGAVAGWLEHAEGI
ncbi:hypothetical protein, partial [Klebsiella pneumoniae]|uniref:hypothetical protein n=1 Tax=Klebsiella pneumoniae TaxID=573 RepID=UPI0025A25EC1